MGSKPVVALICIIAGFAYGVFFISKTYEETISIKQSEYQQLSANLAQLQIQSLNKEETLKQLQNKWNEEKKYLLNKIDSFSNVNFSNIAVENNFNNVDIKNNDYTLQEVYYNDLDSPPIGYVQIFNNGLVKSKTYNHDIVVNSIISKDSNGNYVALSKANLIIREESKVDKNKKWLNKEYSLQITNGSLQINSVQDKLLRKTFFNPSITLNANMTLDNNIQYIPSLGFSLFKYCKSEKDLFMFPEIQFGAISLDNYLVSFVPISFNIGNLIKIIKNTYVKPFIGLHNEDFSYGMGIGLNF